MFVDKIDASDVGLTVIQFIACCAVVIGFSLLVAYFLFTRCLKRRPDPETGIFEWKCRRATFKCKCFRRKARELKEPKEEPIPEDEEDQSSRRMPEES